MTTVLFVVFPYVAVFLAVFAGIYRYFSNRFSYSALSSELLESRQLFWGSVSWHYGIILILLAHLFAFLFPGVSAAILGTSTRLVVLELIGLSLALYTAVGIVILIARRFTSSLARVATSPMDWILLFVLLIQVLSGIGIALADRWGSLWYLSNAVPWLRSLARFSPEPDPVSPLSLLIKLHILNGFLVILLFPFSRLVHLISFPVSYLWRPYQVVIWNLTPRRPRLASPSLQPAAAFAGATDPGSYSHSTGGDSADEALDLAEPESPSRRQLLTRISLAAGALAAAIVALPSVAFLLGLFKPREVWRAVGAVDSFQIGKTVEVSFLDSSPLSWAGVTAQTAAWLRRVGDLEFIAFSLHCTHLGCPVRWLQDAELFMCPCHGGVYYKDGRVASGPPRHPLIRYPARVNAGQVEILTSPVPIMSFKQPLRRKQCDS